MTMQANWNGLTFSLDEKGARTLKSLTRRTSLKVQTFEDIVSGSSTATKGLEPFAVDLVFSTSTAAGTNIRELYLEYEKNIGEIDFLFVNGVKFYEKKLQLLSAECSNMVLDGQGRALAADFRLSLREYTPEQKKQRVVRGAGNQKKKPPAASLERIRKFEKGFSGADSKPTRHDKINYVNSIKTSRP